MFDRQEIALICLIVFTVAVTVWGPDAARLCRSFIFSFRFRRRRPPPETRYR
jgi:hypothetical protein